jgi:TorA maturation chaperone TorD
MNEKSMANEWLVRATFYELLAQSFLYPSEVLVAAVGSGDYAQAAREIGVALGHAAGSWDDILDELDAYEACDQQTLFHQLRVEYTRLFIGAPVPVVSPYGGIWQARAEGTEPLLFIGSETLAVERIMRSAGVGNHQGHKEPLDHIGSELEFLQYLCLVLAGVEPAHEQAEVSEAVYHDFVAKHIRNWSSDFANAVLAQSAEPFYCAAAHLLRYL